MRDDDWAEYRDREHLNLLSIFTLVVLSRPTVVDLYEGRPADWA